MIKITHYEVYTDKGEGWQLEDRFAAEQRQDAFNLAKEREAENRKVKIIKEIFDVQDNSYQESVEYVSNLSRKKGMSAGRSWSGTSADEEAASPLPVVETLLSRSSVAGAILKLVLLITISLIFANLFVSLLFPLLEIFVPEENSRPVLFGVFFVVFLAMSVPLLLKSIPWYVFARGRGKPVKEQKFYDRAEYLIRAYNLNSDKEPIATPAFPEAPLEYKQYVISFLSELVSHIQSQSALQNSFSRLGVKLLVYGGCLELARYSGLTLPEANSILYDAFKITDGDKADLEAFYEAKRTYRDNKIAVFLTGVGAHLMSQVINGMPISDNLLNIAFNKWEAQDSNPQTDRFPAPEPESAAAPSAAEGDIIKTTLVSLKSDLKFMDGAMPQQEETASDVSAQIRNIVFNLVNKYQGEDTIEANGITTVRFRKLNNALKFAVECLKDINTYHDELNNENLLMRNCCAITPCKPDEEPNLSGYLADMFEHIYNNEIVMTAEIRQNLGENDYHLDFLGEKNFKSLNITEELYKIVD